MSTKGDQRTVIWIHGSSGKMGREIQQALLGETDTFRLGGGSSKRFEGELFHQGQPVTPKLLAHSLARVDLVFDFSTPEANQVLADAFNFGGLEQKKVLIGTTGLSDKEKKAWEMLAHQFKLAVLMAPNTSIGILTMLKSALVATGLCTNSKFDLEIIETHHRAKVDAPSGTAKFLANSLAEAMPGSSVVTERDGARKSGEIGVHAVRGGGVFGEHAIRFIGDHEELTISHRAFSRALFAKGAIQLGAWLSKQGPGFYALTDVDPQSLTK